MTYVDGFVIPIPKKSLPAYRKLARLGAQVWKEHGALDYKECVADQLKVPDMKGKLVSPFPKMTRLKPGETIVFAYIVYKSRAHRDRVNARVMKDPRVANMPMDKMPFDPKRFAYAGFRTIVEW